MNNYSHVISKLHELWFLIVHLQYHCRAKPRLDIKRFVVVSAHDSVIVLSSQYNSLHCMFYCATLHFSLHHHHHLSMALHFSLTCY